jgi:spermidine synthase
VHGRILISKFRQLGLFSSEPIIPRGSVMRSLSALLEQKCQFESDEVDIVLLQHTFEIVWADGREETITSTLEAYGDRNGGPSAMAKLVGVPCGVAVRLVLDGTLTKPGVHAPYDEETCKLFRDVLEKEEGITMVERTV